MSEADVTSLPGRKFPADVAAALIACENIVEFSDDVDDSEVCDADTVPVRVPLAGDCCMVVNGVPAEMDFAISADVGNEKTVLAEVPLVEAEVVVVVLGVVD